MQLTDKQIKSILNAAGAVIQEAKHHKLPRAVTEKLAELEAATSVEPEGMSYAEYEQRYKPKPIAKPFPFDEYRREHGRSF